MRPGWTRFGLCTSLDDRRQSVKTTADDQWKLISAARNGSTVIVFYVRSCRLSSKKRVQILLRYIYLYTFIKKKKGFETKYGRRVKGKNKLFKEWKLTGQINAWCEPRDVFVRSAARMKRLREGEYKCVYIYSMCVSYCLVETFLLYIIL